MEVVINYLAGVMRAVVKDRLFKVQAGISVRDHVWQIDEPYFVNQEVLKDWVTVLVTTLVCVAVSVSFVILGHVSVD